MEFISNLKLVLAVLMLFKGSLSHSQTNEQIGRIKAFDDMLAMYGREITEGNNLRPAIEEAKRLAKEPGVFKEYADYYVEILELIEESKDPRIVSLERDRLNGIITSASYQHDGQIEINYAILRRNILESFVDSSASYLMELVQTSPELAIERLKGMVKKGSLVGRDDEEEDDVIFNPMEKHDL